MCFDQLLGTLSKPGRQCQRREARRYFFVILIFHKAYLYLGDPVGFYFTWSTGSEFSRQKRDQINKTNKLFLRSVYTGDFCCDFVACKLLAIPRRFESPVVYTCDLKSPRNRAWNRRKNRLCKRAFSWLLQPITMTNANDIERNTRQYTCTYIRTTKMKSERSFELLTARHQCMPRWIGTATMSIEKIST